MKERVMTLDMIVKGLCSGWGVRVKGWHNDTLCFYNVPISSNGFITLPIRDLSVHFLECEYTDDFGKTFRDFVIRTKT